jgi:hypothetical protein
MSVYIITFQSKWKDPDYDENLPDIGFLPFEQIPENSILKKKFFDRNTCFELGDLGGLKGIHYDKIYAEEHLRIEKDWRGKNNYVWMTEIIPKEDIVGNIDIK